MNDCISRQAAIDFCDRVIERDDSPENYVTQAFKAFRYYLMGLPAIGDVKHSKWLLGEKREDYRQFYRLYAEMGIPCEDVPYFIEDEIACPHCLKKFNVMDNCTEDFYYCPNCGAEMKHENL